MVLRLILWDHLSPDIPTLDGADPRRDRLIFFETIREATSVNHHVKKLAFLFSAMRHFAEELAEKGFVVDYTPLEKEEKSLSSGLDRIAKKYAAQRLIVTTPGEYRVLAELQSWSKKRKVSLEVLPDTRFFTSPKEFEEWAHGKKKLLMEHFYQQMRRTTGLLMNAQGDPLGGQFNFDAENRKPLRTLPAIDDPLQFKPDAITKTVLKEVKCRFSKHFGDLEPFWFATKRADALKAFSHFVEKVLNSFGSYQDAMRDDAPFLYHSVISHYLNAGLLSPREVCAAVDKAYRQKQIPINAAEGFIRQILGWREYVRGVYWLKMPRYAQLNFFKAKRKLPWLYWSGETDMNCLRSVIEQTRKYAYSHHIQRLMITGNFALLSGVLPEEVSAWYLAVYADAHEWVELPNTLGMSQFADGGFLATKPYISSGSYIRKMSNFCDNCAYDVEQKEGPKACPFNYLYWDFLLRHQAQLKKNPRMAVAYQTLARFSPTKKKQLQRDAALFLKNLD